MHFYNALILIGVLSLCACTGQSALEEKLYRLAPLPQQQTLNEVDLSLPLVQVKAVKLSQLLDRQGIIYYHSEHGLQISRYHRWAEDLDNAISQALLVQLTALKGRHRFQPASGSQTRYADYSVQLEVDYFNAVAGNKVLSAGYFSLFDRDHQMVFRKPYRIELPVSNAGYESLVDALYQSLLPLAQEIEGALTALK